MKIRAIKTKIIQQSDTDILDVIDDFIIEPEEKSILVVTSKIVSICQGNVVDAVDKKELIERESDCFIRREINGSPHHITITQGILNIKAGIDESNSDGHFILWPNDVSAEACRITSHIRSKYSLTKFGVVIIDSRPSPLRRGVSGFALACAGFNGVRSYANCHDIFGNKLRSTELNVADSLAAAAVFIMGEGNEQTPLALITNLDNIEFLSEVNNTELKNTLEFDKFFPLLKSGEWLEEK